MFAYGRNGLDMGFYEATSTLLHKKREEEILSKSLQIHDWKCRTREIRSSKNDTKLALIFHHSFELFFSSQELGF